MMVSLSLVSSLVAVAGAAKVAAVRLADVSSRAIGARYGIGAAAVNAIHQRLAARPDVLLAVEELARRLS